MSAIGYGQKAVSFFNSFKRLDIKALLIITLLVWLVYAFFFKKKGVEPQDNAQDTMKTVKDEAKTSGKLTFSESQLTIAANSLLGAMDKLGTDEETIFSIFQKYNKYELDFIYASFGIVRYDGMGKGKIIGSDLDLVGWLSRELSSAKYLELRKIAQAKGLTWFV